MAGMEKRPAWSRSDWLYIGAILSLNVLISWKLFGLQYSQFMGSIEGAYIGISRHILTSNWDWRWWPAWNGGIPFENSYPPLLHFLVAAVAGVSGLPVARAHHIVTAAFFCLGPATAYLAARKFGGKSGESFLAAILYSVVAPSALLVPAIAADMSGAWKLRRLHALIVYGDGPHIAALAMIPLAILLLQCAIEKREPAWDFLAALSFAAVALTNWIGCFSLAVIAVCLLTKRQDWIRAACIGIGAYAIAAPWLLPSLIRTIQFNAQTVGGDFRATSGRVIWFLPCLAVALVMLRKTSVFLKFALIIGTLTLLRAYFHYDIVPQAGRYHLEMDLGLIFGGVPWIAQTLTSRFKTVAVVALLIVCGEQTWRSRAYAGEIIKEIDTSQRVEFISADWLARNDPGGRVMVPGSIQFWLNAFSDASQIGGGFENGNINWENRVARYYIDTGQDAANLVLWLKAFGIRAVETTGPDSDEVYKDFVNPRVFDGTLDQAWRSGDNTIYRVPGESLAHAIPRSSLVSRPPVNGLDVTEVKRYVDSLASPAKVIWVGNSKAIIEASVAPGEVISFQENFHKGWRSNSGTILQDGLGFMAIEGSCLGFCRIELTFDGGLEMAFAKACSFTALAGGIAWAFYFRRRRPLSGAS